VFPSCFTSYCCYAGWGWSRSSQLAAKAAPIALPLYRFLRYKRCRSCPINLVRWVGTSFAVLPQVRTDRRSRGLHHVRPHDFRIIVLMVWASPLVPLPGRIAGSCLYRSKTCPHHLPRVRSKSWRGAWSHVINNARQVHLPLVRLLHLPLALPHDFLHLQFVLRSL